MSSTPPQSPDDAETMTPALSPDDRISLQEAARLLGCTERHVHRYLAQGKLTSTREGRNHRLRRGDVTALAQRRTRRSAR